MISETDLVIRLLAAAALGAIVGYEREVNNQPAGLRTHIILVVGSALAMILSINLAIQFKALAPNGDPARLAAQVIPGIGFLGAGAILRYGSSIKGLTTATSLWTMAIVGLVVGAGSFVAAVIATALILVALILLNLFEKRFIRPVIVSHLTITTVDKSGMLQKVRETVEMHARLVSEISIQKNIHRKRARFEMTIKLHEGGAVDDILRDLAEMDGIRLIKLN